MKIPKGKKEGFINGVKETLELIGHKHPTALIVLHSAEQNGSVTFFLHVFDWEMPCAPMI